MGESGGEADAESEDNVMTGNTGISITCGLLAIGVVLAVVLLAGCAQDPQVNVTPFVLKSDQPPNAAAPPPEGIQPCTPAFEQAVSGGVNK
jgi:hypothetical protein